MCNVLAVHVVPPVLVVVLSPSSRADIGVVEHDSSSSVGDLDVLDDTSLRDERLNCIEPDCLSSIILKW